MSQRKENKPPSSGFNGVPLATQLDSGFFVKSAASTVTSPSVTLNEKSRPASAEKSRQDKIREVLGDPGSNSAVKVSKLNWRASPAEASSSKQAPSSTASYATSGPRLQASTSLSSTTEKTQAVSASEDSRFPCPYPDCKRGFWTVTDLRKHKLDDHDYCKVCDEDFEDFDAFHEHKIASERHITCTVCSVDFKSEMGRDRHYTQMHGSAHNIKCKGCNVTFSKGAGLLLHFERNLCRPKEKHGISADRFESQRAGVAMIMQSRNKKPEEGDSGFLSTLPGISFRGSVAASTVDGGVPIEPEEQPDFLLDNDEIRSIHFPPLSKASGRPPSPAESDASTNLLTSEHHYALNAGNLAALDQKNYKEEIVSKASEAGWPVAGWPVVGKDKDDITEGMSNMGVSARLFPNAKRNVLPGGFVPPSVQPSRSGYSDLDSNSIQLYPNAATGFWECPYYKCPYKCELRQDLELHFNDRNNGHRGFDHVCPSCLKRFKTPSALMAHLESASTRCTIRESKGYGNVLHLVSGGHLNVDGRHNDGSSRIVSPEDAGKVPDIVW